MNNHELLKPLKNICITATKLKVNSVRKHTF